MNTFGTVLRFYRERAHLSMNELGRAAHIDPSYVSRLEQGTREPPRPVVLRTIVAALGLTTQEERQFLLAALGYSEAQQWLDAQTHAATVSAAAAMLADCPCRPCQAKRRGGLEVVA